MTNYNLETNKLLAYQFYLTIFFVVSLFISLILTYNQILKNNNQEPLFKNEHVILLFNRCFASLIAFGFLCINIVDKNIRTNYGKCDKKIANMQIGASVLTLIATLIVLNVTTRGSNLENPEL